MWWHAPGSLLKAKGYFLGERDNFIGRLGILRSVCGVAILAGIAIAYPEYSRSLPEVAPANGVGGWVTASQVAGNCLFTVLYGLCIFLLCLIVFGVAILALARSGSRLAMLRDLRWPFIAFAVFVGLMFVTVGPFYLISDVLNSSVVQVNPGEGIGSLLVGLVLNVALLVVTVIAAIILAPWYVKGIYFAAVDVFRADDAHPLLAPFATTVASWTLAIVALLAGGPTGLPRGLALLIVLGGPTTVSILNTVACVRLLRDYHCLLFRDGPGRYSREEPRTTGHSRAVGVAERRLVISAATGIAVLNLLLVIFVAPGTHQLASASSRPAATSLRWSFTAEGSYITDPAAAGGTIYIGSDNGLVYALDAATGSARWSYPTAGGGFSNAAVAGGTVYIGSENGTVYALNAATGKARWASPIAGPSGTGSPGFYGPAVADGTVYIGSENGTVYALNAANGKVRWSYPTQGRILSAPAVADGTVYVGSNDDRVYALNAATGKTRWTHLTGSYVDSAPAVAGGTVYIGSDDDRVYALNAATGKTRWTFPTEGSVLSGPAVARGIVYVGSDDDRVYALNAATGKTRWTFPTANFVSTNPVVAGHTVYVSGVGRTLYALRTAS